MNKICYYKNPNGATIGVKSLPVLRQDGLYFKDIERDGVLHPYEDWRLPAQERARDLAGRLSTEEIAGLMLYSRHQMVPASSTGPFVGTYEGKKPEESDVPEWSLTDQQKRFLVKDRLRNVLAVRLKNGEVAAKWNNEMQALCEEMPHAIPVNICTDPRHSPKNANAEYKSGARGTSKWPDGLALAAVFDPETAREFGRVAAREYRALGITTALGPQFDLGCEPRWMRTADTFGASPKLVCEIGKAYCEGLQTDPDAPQESGGWGSGSVAAMGKHWPGGGSGEGGRDAHYPFGKFAVYPGGCEEDHKMPFLEGALHLGGPTGQVAAIMPYYTVSWNMDPSGEQAGNSYSRYVIRDLLREKYGYDGILCTDWGITGDPLPEIDSFGSRCYGAENLSVAERHLRILENGIDQFGGNNDAEPVLEAYRIGCERYGEEKMRARFEESAVRILTGMFRLGLFENPYLDPDESGKLLGCPAFTEAGFAAQLKSVVLLKNDGVLPMAGKKVYIPSRKIGERKTFFRGMAEAEEKEGVPREIAEKFFEVAETPQEADFALCFIESPITDQGYRKEDGYRPITLQYRPYTAATARETSIAGGDFREASANRSYRGKTNTAANESDLDMVLKMREVMGEKPVIVVLQINNPCIVAEFEAAADAILADFGVQPEAVLSIISGQFEPCGRLPVQMPADMEAVEAHCEDRPLDIRPYRDSAGHAYDFGYGMSWSGPLPEDSRFR